LHTFHVLGQTEPNWYGFFNRPEEDPFRAFFTRHPGLHSICISWDSEEPYCESINSADLGSLFPSLVHLGAPAFFCAPIVAPSLAGQIESLWIVDEFRGPNLSEVAQATRQMPKLRKLVLLVYSIGIVYMSTTAVMTL
jgi:hypothetical protein